MQANSSGDLKRTSSGVRDFVKLHSLGELGSYLVSKWNNSGHGCQCELLDRVILPNMETLGRSIVYDDVQGQGSGSAPLTVEEVAYGFIQVANEAMCRPIRALTQAKVCMA